MTAICSLIFLHIEATWLLKFSRSSMCTPTNLQVVEGSINVPLTEKLIFSSSVWLYLEFVLLAPVPEKTISTNRGLNAANRGIKFVLRLDCY